MDLCIVGNLQNRPTKLHHLFVIFSLFRVYIHMSPEKDDTAETCPECGSIDYIELEDDRTGTTELVCLDCGFFLWWEIEEGRYDWKEIATWLSGEG
jgi:predicted RNA-binding Zn-ribbon protein involved in translation (DUF1610 family)